MRVSELEGPLIDLWVALALGEKWSDHPQAHAGNEAGLYWLQNGEPLLMKICPCYSTNPRDAYPIIEREQISTLYLETFGEWRASHRLMRGNKSVRGSRPYRRRCARSWRRASAMTYDQIQRMNRNERNENARMGAHPVR